ncbi:MAG: hypothetical protein ABIL62_08075 [Planctomycetota bacterium]
MSLSWSAGAAAISHDVYFSENLADVETGPWKSDVWSFTVPSR